MTSHDESHRIRCNRRRFFPLLLQEIFVTMDSAQGAKPGHQLNDLADLPPEQLFAIKPVMNPRYRIFLQDGHVCARHMTDDDESAHEYVLFPTEQYNLTVFNNFTGKLSLGAIRDLLVRDMQWEEEQAADHVRELFLSLAARLICFPQNSPDEED